MKYFDINTASKRLEIGEKLPEPVALFDHFWVEDETCILFASANVGKSILAVQIGEAIASGRNIGGFFVSSEPLSVLYFDFELSDKQFYSRYSAYKFHANLSFATPKPIKDEVKSQGQFEKERLNEIKEGVLQGNFKIVIIDNLTWINGESEKGNVSAKFMQSIQGFAREHSISVLVIAHTPKRNNINPIGMNDLFGSSMLANFVDSMFAIGESKTGHNIRYIKQIKVRMAEKIYHFGNVNCCKLGKLDNGFLGYKTIGTESENQHLTLKDQEQKDENIEEANKLYKEGKSYREIAKILGTSHVTVSKWIKSKDK